MFRSRYDAYATGDGNRHVQMVSPHPGGLCQIGLLEPRFAPLSAGVEDVETDGIADLAVLACGQFRERQVSQYDMWLTRVRKVEVNGPFVSAKTVGGS